MLTKRDYEKALEVQNACNLSGVVISFAEVLPRIHAETQSTLCTRQHPISILYADKIASLTGQWDTLKVSSAYQVVEDKIQELSILETGE